MNETFTARLTSRDNNHEQTWTGLSTELRDFLAGQHHDRTASGTTDTTLTFELEN